MGDQRQVLLICLLPFNAHKSITFLQSIIRKYQSVPDNITYTMPLGDVQEICQKNLDRYFVHHEGTFYYDFSYTT